MTRRGLQPGIEPGCQDDSSPKSCASRSPRESQGGSDEVGTGVTPASPRLEVVPCSISDAKAFVRQHHRHHVPPVGGLFALAVARGGRVVGVATVGRPVARNLADGWTAEVTRVCVLDGERNACSMLYGAAWRAAKALGWRRLVTYTLPEEGGASLRGAGWAVRRGGWRRIVVAHVAAARRHAPDAAQVSVGGGMTRGDIRTRREASMSERDDGLHTVARAFCDEVDTAARSWEATRGMRVPYHGGWASMTPSAKRELRWWRDRLRESLAAAERERAAADALIDVRASRQYDDTLHHECKLCGGFGHDAERHQDYCALAAYRQARGAR